MTFVQESNVSVFFCDIALWKRYCVREHSRKIPRKGRKIRKFELICFLQKKLLFANHEPDWCKLITKISNFACKFTFTSAGSKKFQQQLPEASNCVSILRDSNNNAEKAFHSVFLRERFGKRCRLRSRGEEKQNKKKRRRKHKAWKHKLKGSLHHWLFYFFPPTSLAIPSMSVVHLLNHCGLAKQRCAR